MLRPSRWLPGQTAPGTRLRLFCLPFAGGGASLYRSWPKELRGDVDVRPVQLPGREDRIGEPPLDDLFILRDQLADAVSPLLDELPYAVLGYSMGGLLGFELARALRARGRPEPRHLFIIACRPPHVPDPPPHLHALQGGALIAELKRFGGTPDQVLQDPDLMALLTPLIRADARVTEAYVHQPAPPLGCPITVYAAEGDGLVPLSQMDGWRQHTSAEFTLRTFPGDHFFAAREARARVLGALSEDLRRIARD